MGDDMSMKFYEVQAELIETKVSYYALQKEFDRLNEQMEKERKKEQDELIETRAELMSIKRENSQLKDLIETERRRNKEDKDELQALKIVDLERIMKTLMDEMNSLKKTDGETERLLNEIKNLQSKIDTMEKQMKSVEFKCSLEEKGLFYSLSEIQQRPWLSCQSDYEINCVWNDCDETFPLNIIKKDCTVCPHCKLETPIGPTPNGKKWIFFNECVHISCIPENDELRYCLTCGEESKFQDSTVRTPTKK